MGKKCGLLGQFHFLFISLYNGHLEILLDNLHPDTAMPIWLFSSSSSSYYISSSRSAFSRFLKFFYYSLFRLVHDVILTFYIFPRFSTFPNKTETSQKSNHHVDGLQYNLRPEMVVSLHVQKTKQKQTTCCPNLFIRPYILHDKVFWENAKSDEL